VNPYEVEIRREVPVYSKRGITLVRGEGARVWDDQGRSYIDCVGGHGVANVGHANPFVVAAIEVQARRLITCPESFSNDQRALLLEKLAEVVPATLDAVFLCNSGAEAVEAAIKFARAATGRAEIVAAKGGFHGRTMGALSATWSSKYRQAFEPLVPGFRHVAFGDKDELESAVGDRTAAVLLEVVQGEGGVRLASKDFFAAARQVCDRTGALLIFDEVQTGFGRTGTMFAFEHYGLLPDILCLAKAIAGGLPMGATLVNGRVQGLRPGLHGTTFGGNPLVCAAAVAAIDYIRAEKLPERAMALGQEFMDLLRQIQAPVVKEVRGLGLMVGIELRRKVTPYLKALADRGVLALPAGPNVIRYLPPLVISAEDLHQVAELTEQVLRTEVSYGHESDE
jgi:acetylornithine/LysW-gamma-L-lysine aminotransferase